MKYHIVDAYWMSVKNKRIKIRYHIACGKKVIAGTHILQKRKCRKHCDNLLFTISCEKLPKISILENGLIVTGWNHIWPSKKDIKKLKALKGKKNTLTATYKIKSSKFRHRLRAWIRAQEMLIKKFCETHALNYIASRRYINIISITRSRNEKLFETLKITIVFF